MRGLKPESVISLQGDGVRKGGLWERFEGQYILLYRYYGKKNPCSVIGFHGKFVFLQRNIHTNMYVLWQD